jgi:hypothetical protein
MVSPAYFWRFIVTETYTSLEIASATGNRLLKFSSKDGKVVYDVLNQELGCGGVFVGPTGTSPPSYLA